MWKHTETFAGTAKILMSVEKPGLYKINYFNNMLYHFTEGLSSHTCVCVCPGLNAVPVSGV